MLQTNGVDKVKSKLNSLKYTNQEVKDIVIDSVIKDSTEVIKDLPSYKKLQDNSKLTTSQIKQWVNINSNKYIMKLWNWKLSVTAKDAIAKGLKGKDIGDYIKNKEAELFSS